ncbi:hypothetical protein ASZ90_015357 [hydrocarbon metagenome]|uniref:PIN domain-containing protein n=1 Tax=hydrocarbon metagenome TaxID=938273 RepID=A0A0W8F2L9_9ZZZZ
MLALYHFFIKDPRHEIAVSFMNETRERARGTTIYNLLELAGILASAGKADLGKSLIGTYATAADMQVLFPRPSSLSPDAFWADYTGDLVDVMARGLCYGDAKVLWVAERNDASCLVTWNTRLYRDRTSFPVCTPDEVQREDAGSKP